MQDTLHTIAQVATGPHTSWTYGLILFFGTMLKIAFDIFDKNLSTKWSEPEGKKTIGSWVLGGLCSLLFFLIIVLANVTAHAQNDWSFAAYLLLYAATGYLAPHMFLKITSWWDKKTNQKLTITDTHTVETSGTPPKTDN
jgi:protein-S-isoprenylcysteine O-methyltransferase Ste14